MATIYFDESGQTGAHLFDPQQPCFTLGSTDLTEVEAADIIRRCFPREQGDEIKSKSIMKSASGRAGFLAFAEEVGRIPERFFAVRMDKRFAIIAKMVDNLVEPMLRDQGYDFYADNYAARYANMAYYALDTILGRPALDPLLAAYNAFARSPEAGSMAALARLLAETAETAPYGSGRFLAQMQAGAEQFGDLHDIAKFEDSNDLHVTAAVQSMSFWQDRHSDDFEVVHDESIHFFDREERWRMMTDPSLPATVIDLGSKRLTLPIRVASTVSARSHECPPLQVADLIAGFVTRASAERQSAETQAFFEEAVARGMNGLSIYPVEAGTDFVGGPPPLAEGPDAVDRIAMAVARGRTGKGSTAA